MHSHELYMRRCLTLAELGSGMVAPNPMVGSVLVYNDTIIGEGYHQQYGKAHAEVNCLQSVSAENRDLISESTLYVSLEPCAHYGKTPPCADLIISYNIKRVVIGCRDPFNQVNGRGIEKLEQAGIEVITGVLQGECIELNKRFFKFHVNRQPYIILKWAQSADGIIGSETAERLMISNSVCNRLVHKWRSREMGILIGTNTALLDDPQLTTRLWPAKSPLRIVLDLNLRLPSTLKIFDRQSPTIVVNYQKQVDDDWCLYYKVERGEEIIPQILSMCYQMNIQSILVEGGSRLLQSFIDGGFWNEALVIENTTLIAGKGVKAPILTDQKVTSHSVISSDTVTTYMHV